MKDKVSLQKKKYKQSPKGQITQHKYYRSKAKKESNKRYRAKYRDVLLIRNQAFRKRTLFKLGDKCNKCSFSDWRALQVDHRDGGGSIEQKEIGIYQIYLKILSGETNRYQLLCANCNWIKRYEQKEHNQFLKGGEK